MFVYLDTLLLHLVSSLKSLLPETTSDSLIIQNPRLLGTEVCIFYVQDLQASVHKVINGPICLDIIVASLMLKMLILRLGQDAMEARFPRPVPAAKTMNLRFVKTPVAVQIIYQVMMNYVYYSSEGRLGMITPQNRQIHPIIYCQSSLNSSNSLAVNMTLQIGVCKALLRVLAGKHSIF